MRLSQTVSSVSRLSSCGTTPRRGADLPGRRAPGSRPSTRSSRRERGDTQPIMRIVELLPAPFGPEEAERLARLDREVDAVDRDELAEALHEPPGNDRTGALAHRFEASGRDQTGLDREGDVCEIPLAKSRGSSDQRDWRFWGQSLAPAARRSSTGRGTAPNEPWSRNATSGSRTKSVRFSSAVGTRRAKWKVVREDSGAAGELRLDLGHVAGHVLFLA